MVELLTTTEPAAVRARIAACYLGEEQPAQLGTITLHAHQRIAVARLSATLDDCGGALLADDVGLGKTYVAIALARRFERVLVVAPAALRRMWADAMHAAECRAEITSYSTLSHHAGPAGPFDLLILDEAHHARTPGTHRYARLAVLAAGARVLLLSATPIHNTRRDLAALLALFLGARAWALSDDALARYIVRREHADVSGDLALPMATEPRWLHVGDDESLLQAILELPAPLVPSDGGDGGALVMWNLVRQWASSNGAFVSALRRRLVRAAALDAALAGGRLLSRSELTSWISGDRAVQLAFPGLFAATAPPAPVALRRAIVEHEAALRALLARARDGEWTDAVRARLLSELRVAHPGEKIVAFTQFADTARALFQQLRAQSGVAALTARGALVAGGSLSRGEAIARFAPLASGTAPPREANRIDLLLTTDMLSEGVNLHDASVVVHLDLPWTPARLEQRVGRSRRIGALHGRTAVYMIAPPASSEALLRVEQRLGDKLRAAGRAIGIAGAILPSFGDVPAESAARRRELVRQAVAAWCAPDPVPADTHGTVPLVVAVRAPRAATLALVREGDTHHLVAAFDDAELVDDPAIVLDVVHLASGSAAPLDGDALARARGAAERWITRRAALRIAGAALPLDAPARRHALRRIATITARVPHHRRAVVAELASRARRAATMPYGIGGEDALEELNAVEMPDEAWLDAVAELGKKHRETAERREQRSLTLVALIALQP
jgi:superfamily II DNA or RNA helicase